VIGPRTVKGRLLSVIVVSVAAALALMTAGFNVLLARSLSSDAAKLAGALAAGERDVLRVVDGRLVLEEAPEFAGLESQVWVLSGDRVLEAPRANKVVDRVARGLGSSPARSFDVPRRQVRLFATPVLGGGQQVGTIVVGISMAPYERTRRIALAASLILAAGLLVVVALSARWLLEAALTPVAKMTEDAERWSVRDLDRRFAMGEPRDELTHLGATLDGLLDRLAGSLRREQRFTAELSHELRTPLARISAEAEVALRRERPAGEYRDALETVLRSARQMTRMVETLLAAFQQETGLARGRADVGQVLAVAAAAVSDCVSRRGLELAVAPGDSHLDVGVESDFALRILGPVVENACRFAATRIEMGAGHSGTGDVVISISDDGPGVPADDRERIFEPGVRGEEPAASQGEDSFGAGVSPTGAGLGLALSRRLARAASGDVVAVEPARGAAGARFLVRLPSG
jgi:two-component system, OmpR family, sensor kinase